MNACWVIIARVIPIIGPYSISVSSGTPTLQKAGAVRTRKLAATSVFFFLVFNTAYYKQTFTLKLI